MVWHLSLSKTASMDGRFFWSLYQFCDFSYSKGTRFTHANQPPRQRQPSSAQARVWHVLFDPKKKSCGHKFLAKAAKGFGWIPSQLSHSPTWKEKVQTSTTEVLAVANCWDVFTASTCQVCNMLQTTTTTTQYTKSGWFLLQTLHFPSTKSCICIELCHLGKATRLAGCAIEASAYQLDSKRKLPTSLTPFPAIWFPFHPVLYGNPPPPLIHIGSFWLGCRGDCCLSLSFWYRKEPSFFDGPRCWRKKSYQIWTSLAVWQFQWQILSDNNPGISSLMTSSTQSFAVLWPSGFELLALLQPQYDPN